MGFEATTQFYLNAFLNFTSRAELSDRAAWSVFVTQNLHFVWVGVYGFVFVGALACVTVWKPQINAAGLPQFLYTFVLFLTEFLTDLELADSARMAGQRALRIV